MSAETTPVTQPEACPAKPKVVGPQYSARVLEKIDYGKGVINGLRVGIFVTENDVERQIGTYDRNYSSFGETTFHPFKLNDRWFAIYSKHYTCTRLMTLPDCLDVGGEPPASHGFCPVEYHIPKVMGRIYDDSDPEPVVANHQADIWATKVQEGNSWRYYWPDDKDHPQPDEAKKAAYLKAKEESHAAAKAWRERHPMVEKYAPFGFVAGCVWGDDSSWKIAFIDLSKAEEGVVTIDHRFGYIELPSSVSLKDAISMRYASRLNAPLDQQTVDIALPIVFTMDGKRRSRWDEKTADELEVEKRAMEDARDELRDTLRDLVAAVKESPLPNIELDLDTPPDIREAKRKKWSMLFEKAEGLIEKHKET